MQSRGTRTGIDLGLDRRYIALWQRHPIRKDPVEDNAAAAGRSIPYQLNRTQLGTTKSE